MNRRECLQTLVLGGSMTALLRTTQAISANIASGSEIVIHDGRFAAAREWSQHVAASLQARPAWDCAHDAARLWCANVMVFSSATRIHGMTLAADAMILADFGRQHGFRLRINPAAPDSNGLVEWTMRRSKDG